MYKLFCEEDGTKLVFLLVCNAGQITTVIVGGRSMCHRPRCIKVAFERKSEKSNAN